PNDMNWKIIICILSIFETQRQLKIEIEYNIKNMHELQSIEICLDISFFLFSLYIKVHVIRFYGIFAFQWITLVPFADGQVHHYFVRPIVGAVMGLDIPFAHFAGNFSGFPSSP
ncbi:hypothetical protein ACJX0J_010019, partial [Zea mays]